MTAVWAKMPYYSYKFSGDDAKNFLQGQLTQDINIITPNACHYSAYCNNKGQMLASLVLSNEDDDIIVRIHKRQADNVINYFRKFILRSKVEIARVSQYHIALNRMAAELLCLNANIKLPKVFSAIYNNKFNLLALPNRYYELRSNDMKLLSFIQQQCKENYDVIESLRISGGNFHVFPETEKLLLPQQTVLEKWGAISYDKGCYIGQEIIARNKYLGKVKKGLAIAKFDNLSNIKIGEKITYNNNEVGTVIEYHKAKTNSVCLAIMLLETKNNACNINGITAVFSFI